MPPVLDYQGIFAVFGPWLMAFGLILIRLTGLFLTTPILSAPFLSPQVKMGLVGTLTILVMSTTDIPPALTQLNTMALAGAAIMELLIGATMGFAIMLLFGALNLTGQLLGIQMGFAIANVVDPSTGAQAGVLAQVLNLMCMLLFIAFDGHLLLIRALFDSFVTVPIGSANPQTNVIISELIDQSVTLFHIGLRIGLPVVCTVLLINVGLATIARTVPQVNIFVIGFLITIGVGMLVLGMSIPTTAFVFQTYLEEALQRSVKMPSLF